MRRLLSHSPDTAGGLMTSEPVVLAPDTTVAEALARVRDPDLTPALASLVFVVRPPTATPTGRYLGCVHLQRLLREPPAALVGGILDTDLPSLSPEDSLAGGHPVLRCLQPGLRSGGRRGKPPVGRGDPSTTCSTICCPTTGGSARNPNCPALCRCRRPSGWRPHERPVGAPAPGHPAHVAAPFALQRRRRGRRAVQRIDRPVPRHRALPAMADHPRRSSGSA